MSEENVFYRLKEERKRLSLTQLQVAEAIDASKRSVIDWEKKVPIPADKLSALGELGFDVQYVLTGIRSENFEDRLGYLKHVTQWVGEIAETRDRKPDFASLGRIRDFSVKACLDKNKMEKLFDLLDQAREDSFWVQE